MKKETNYEYKTIRYNPFIVGSAACTLSYEKFDDYGLFAWEILEQGRRGWKVVASGCNSEGAITTVIMERVSGQDATPELLEVIQGRKGGGMKTVKELHWAERNGLAFDLDNVQSAATKLLPAALKAEDTILHGERYEGELKDHLEETALRISNILLAWRDMQENISDFPEIHALKKIQEKGDAR